MKMTDRSVADELEGEVEVEKLGELGGEVHREALEPVVPGQLLLRLNQHRVGRVLNNKEFGDDYIIFSTIFSASRATEGSERGLALK
jgi:hypothetical protein